MSYGGYSQYGGNPYGGGQQNPQGGYNAQNPYGATTDYNQQPDGGFGLNPYAGQQQQAPTAPYPTGQTQPSAPYPTGPTQSGPAPPRPQPPQTYSDSNYSRTQSAPGAGGYIPDPSQPPVPQQNAVMSNQDFLTRVEGVKSEIRQLTANIGEIGSLHQRILSSPDNSASAQLDNLVAQTQVLNTRIKDQIKTLEVDAAKSGRNQTKDSQIRTLKSNFKSQLEDYQREEQTYRGRYREQISRQYRIVNPEATDQEVREAADANWGDEGVFQTALKSNRTGAANSVLGSVRARHNDIQQIERTLIELNQLFQDLAEQVILQDSAIVSTEMQTDNVVKDTTQGNVQLTKGIKSARNARKLKWWCFFIVVAIIAIIALVLGLYFGVAKN